MNSRLELGRIAGIPITLDMFFMLIMFLLFQRYFTSGDNQMMLTGLLIIAGLVVSILLHELSHAVMAWVFKIRVQRIDLTGLGGVIQFRTSLPSGGFKRMAIYLAGPAVNYALSVGCSALAGMPMVADKQLVADVLLQLASINMYLCIFNLLPAFPLDGGHTLDALLGKVMGGFWAQRVTAVLGFVVAVLVGWWAFQSLPNSLFLLLLAFLLLETNWVALRQVGAFGGRR